jgi:hypothetical protein
MWQSAQARVAHWPRAEAFNADTIQRLLAERILGLAVARTRQDMMGFIVDPEPLAIWSRSYFQQLAQRIQLV